MVNVKLDRILKLFCQFYGKFLRRGFLMEKVPINFASETERQGQICHDTLQHFYCI